MFSTTGTTARLTRVSSIIILALFASLFIFQTPAAFAQSSTGITATELQAMIQKVTAQITALQNGASPQIGEIFQPKATSTAGSESNPKTNPNIKTFTIGSSVQPTTDVRVRKLPSRTSAVVGTENNSSRGVILAGPKTQAGYQWYKVSFKAGVTGWVPAQRLNNATSNLDVYNCTPGTACPGSVLAAELQPFVETLLAVAQPNTQSAGAKGNYVDANFEIEITAQDSPLYINRNSFNLFPSLGEKSPATDNPVFSQAVTSRDATEAGPYYLVKEGETRLFRVSYQYFPRESGEYTVVMQNFEFALSPTGRPFRHELFPHRPQTNIALFKVGTATTTTSPIGTASCVSGVKKYIEGTKLQQITVDGRTTTIADASYVCRSGMWKIEGSLPVKPVDPSTSTTYGLTDVKSVTKKLVDPIPLAIDDEYVLYRIELKSAQVYEVKVFGNQLSTTRDANFKKTGYTGEVSKLLLLAIPLIAPTVVPSRPASMVKGASIDLLENISGTLREISKIIADIK